MIPFTEFLQPSAMLVLLTPPPIVNTDGLGIRMSWNVHRTRSTNADQATITLTNLSYATRRAMHESWKYFSQVFGYTIELSIGWGGLMERVFVGDAWKMIPEERTGEDVITTFETGDGNKQIRDATVGQNFANVSIDVILKYLVTTVLKVPLDPASEALILARAALLPIMLWNNYVLQGDPQDRLDELIETLGLEWKIYNGVFIAMEKGNAATASPIAFPLNVKTGLLDWWEENDGNIGVLALANPNVKPGHRISVIDSFGVPVGSPAHRVESITFTGSTDGDSVMEISARKSVLL